MNSVSIGNLQLGIDMPGRAGDLQASGAVPALVRELGDNYAKYHAFLAHELTKSGGRPDPDAYKGDLDGYAAASAHVQRIMIAESILRKARGMRQFALPLDAPPDGTPFVDEAERLVAADGTASTEPPLRDPDAWKPPTADATASTTPAG